MINMFKSSYWKSKQFIKKFDKIQDNVNHITHNMMPLPNGVTFYIKIDDYILSPYRNNMDLYISQNLTQNVQNTFGNTSNYEFIQKYEF